MIQLVFSAPDGVWDEYAPVLPGALAEAGLEAQIAQAGEVAPEAVDYIVFAPSGPIADFTPYTRARAALSLWAGVEQIVGNETLTMPLARMVDPKMTEGMVQWVLGHTMRHHLGLDAHIVNPEGEWRFFVPPLPEDRVVTVLGLGALGAACARALAGAGFAVRGWSRGAKEIEGVASFSGDAGLRDALNGAQIIVTLLPATPATENTLNTETLGWLAQGSFVLNPGRGTLIDDAALLKALKSGRLAHATLDTFRDEPLPRDHPFWANPGVTVTAHTASATRPASAAQSIAQNIRRAEAGEGLVGLVDRAAGY